jgi:hypothetical protein
MTEEINFNSLNMKISSLIKTYPIEKQEKIFEYLSEMDKYDRKAYDIAYDHLGTSFNIARTNGFKKWLEERSK